MRRFEECLRIEDRSSSGYTVMQDFRSSGSILGLLVVLCKAVRLRWDNHRDAG